MDTDTTIIVLNDTLKLLSDFPSTIYTSYHSFVDTINQLSSVKDTLIIKNISDKPSIPIEVIGLLGVILGGIISFLTSLILENQKSKIAIKRDYFAKRFNAYNEIMKLLYKGYSVIQNTTGNETGDIYPKSYNSFNELKEWLI